MVDVEAAQLDAIPASPKRRGRKLFGTRDPKRLRLLRKAARLRVDGKAKSDLDALRLVSDGDDRLFESVRKTWLKMKTSLIRQAERVKEIEIGLIQKNCGGGQTEITTFDPDSHRNAPRGACATYALINQNSTDWEPACRAGWHPAEFFGDGEALIRRDLWGVMTLEEFESSAPIQRWLREAAALIGENR